MTNDEWKAGEEWLSQSSARHSSFVIRHSSFVLRHSRKGVRVDGPLHFESYLRPMVWGGRRLAEALGKHLPGDGPYGEAWEVSDHASHSSRVDRGPLAGLTL